MTQAWPGVWLTRKAKTAQREDSEPRECGKGVQHTRSHPGHIRTQIPDGSLLWDTTFPAETLHTYLRTPDRKPTTDPSTETTIVFFSLELLVGVCPREGSLQSLLLLAV